MNEQDGIMKEATWIFDKVAPGTKQRDSVSEEFFTNGTRLSAIIRESIQNSLDAWTNPGGDGKHPVRVRIYHSGETGALSASAYAKYRETAEERYSSPKNGLERPLPGTDENCRFICIEDFNTSGLTGRTDFEPTDEEEESHGEEWNYFNFFFRENGTSKGQKDTRGSWGAGKCVFQRASRLKTSFALSIRDGERWTPREFFVGVSTLKIHRDASHTTWAPDGWYGILVSGEAVNQIPKQPVSDPEAIATFKRDFNLLRKDEPGTSIVIPYLRLSKEDEEGADYDQNSLIRAVLENFLVAIINGELEVEIQDGPTGIPIQVNAQTLSAHAGKLPMPGNRSAIVTRLHYDLIAQALSETFPQGGKFEAKSPGAKPDWKDEMFTREQLRAMKKRLVARKPILVDVPMPILKKGENGNENAEGRFRVAIQRADLERPMSPAFFRLGLLVDAVRTTTMNYYVSAVIVEKGAVADMLVAAEPPSHNEWKQDADRLARNYRYPKKHLTFVQMAVRSILDAIDSSDREKSFEPLADVFGIPKEIEEEDDEKRKTKKDVDKEDGADSTEPPAPPQAKKAFVEFPEIQGERKGFKIVSGPGLSQAKAFPLLISFKVGYDTFRGMDWSPFDFSLDDSKKIQIEKSGDCVTIESAKQNLFKIRVDKAGDFEISVSGFDPNRDVIVDKIRYQYPSEED